MTMISSRIRRLGVRATAVLAATVVLSSGLVGVTSASAAPESVAVDAAPVVTQVSEISRAVTALSGTSFDPGYIISDWSFYNANGMTQAQIQAFLDAKCPTNNCIDTKKMATTARAATNMCPAPYAASASETFAAIIYKVQRSCGVSAKVILVTLQKEQGLLNLQNPTTVKLRKAMGMGCPDTSVCDSKYYGFFNQVYYGASQLKRYGLRTADNISFRTKYQIGVPYATAYHPTTKCGTRSVTVKSKATTALYYYTPYTPNAKALANLTGLGDSCSSYGNRNFWVYYNSWFGNSLAGRGNDAITAAYDKLGGAAGVLGAAGTAPNCATSSSCSQNFAKGVIYWTLKGGALTVSGPIGEAYVAGGGATSIVGAPLAASVTVTDAVNGNGLSQAFSRGAIYSSAAGTFLLGSTASTLYTAKGASKGALGWPTAARACASATLGCAQRFQKGIVYTPASGAAGIMSATAYAYYNAHDGENGALGLPTSLSVAVVDKAHGNGSTQSFQGGMLHTSAAGTFMVTSAMLPAYSKAGWVRKSLGWPIAEQVCADGACMQTFAGGTIRSTSAGSFVVGTVTNTKIKAYYTAKGGVTGPLGYATGLAVNVVDKKSGNGTTQTFEGGWVHSSAAGTFLVTTAMMPAYSKGGWLRGTLGWPTADQTCVAGVCTQKFTGGTIRQPATGDSFVVAAVTNAKIKAYYTSSGGATGPLGYAKTAAVAVVDKTNGNGIMQTFEGGIVHSSVSGTFLVSSLIMPEYSKAGWVRKSLGWPIADQVCASGTCTQAFSGGTLSIAQ